MKGAYDDQAALKGGNSCRRSTEAADASADTGASIRPPAPRLAPRLPPGVAADGPARRPDHRGGRDPEGDGLRDDRRACRSRWASTPRSCRWSIYAVLGTSRPLSVSTTTTIAILTAAELGEVVPDGDPAALLGRIGDADAARRGCCSCWRRSCGSGFVGELHLRAGADRLQGGDRARHRARPGAEAARHPLREGRRSSTTSLAIVQNVPETSLATLAVGVATIALLVGSSASCRARPRRSSRSRSGSPARSARAPGARRRVGRGRSRRVCPSLHAARPLAGRALWPARSASRS